MRNFSTRYWALTIAWAAILSTAQADEEKPLEVILVAGQSNALGFDANPAKLPESRHDKDVRFWFRCGDPPVDRHDVTSSGKWTRLAPQPKGEPKPKGSELRQYGNFFGEGGGFGPEIGLARTLRKYQPERRLAIVKVAFSGTAIGTDWNPDAKEGEVQGDCYRALVAETKAAIAAAEEDGETVKLRAFVWLQGESDSNAKDAPFYAERLEHMIDRLRRDLESPELTALIAVNAQYGLGKRKHVPDIISAQQAVAEKDAHATYVDTSKASIANQSHFDTQGTLDVGRWFAEALMELEGN